VFLGSVEQLMCVVPVDLVTFGKHPRNSDHSSTLISLASNASLLTSSYADVKLCFRPWIRPTSSLGRLSCPAYATWSSSSASYARSDRCALPFYAEDHQKRLSNPEALGNLFGGFLTFLGAYVSDPTYELCLPDQGTTSRATRHTWFDGHVRTPTFTQAAPPQRWHRLTQTHMHTSIHCSRV